MWDRMMNAFAGSSGLRHEFARGTARWAPGAELLLKNRRGRTLLRWKVAEWAPPSRLALAGREPGSIRGFQASLALTLTPRAQGPTSAEIAFVLILENLALEFLTFLLPVRWLYGRCLDRMLRALRTSVR